MTITPQTIALAAIILFLFVVPLAWALFWSGPGKRANDLRELREGLDAEPLPVRMNCRGNPDDRDETPRPT